jgi:hypothetical protein
MRFCPACGFKLDGVADLLLRDGVPANPLPVPQANQRSPKQKGIRVGAKILFASLALFIPLLALSGAVDSPEPLILPFILFLIGIFWVLYYKLFGEEQAPIPVQPPVIQPPPAHPPQPPSLPAYRPPVETPQEHSVVEHTTRSLGQP